MGRAGYRTGNVDFWIVTLVLYLCMWLFGSPDTDIVYVHLATYMERGFIAEDESFYEILFLHFNCISSQKSRIFTLSAGVRACTNRILYGLKHSRLCKTSHAVIFGMSNSMLALATELRVLRRNASRTLSMFSSDTRGRPELFPLHKHPVSENCRYHLVMLFLHGASFLNRARSSRCTVITDLDTSKRSTRKTFSCCDAILETGPSAPRPV